MITLPLNQTPSTRAPMDKCPPERKPRVSKADLKAAVEDFGKFYQGASFFVADTTVNELRPVLKAFEDAGIAHEARYLRMDPVENCSGVRVWRLHGEPDPGQDSDWENIDNDDEEL